MQWLALVRHSPADLPLPGSRPRHRELLDREPWRHLEDRRAEGLLELAERVGVGLEVERRDAVAYDLDRVAEVAGVGRGVEHADVRAVADEAERVDAALAERDVEVGAEEPGEPTLRDDDLARARRELRHDLRAGRPLER